MVPQDPLRPQFTAGMEVGKLRAETFPGAGSVLGLDLSLKTRENQMLKVD